MAAAAVLFAALAAWGWLRPSPPAQPMRLRVALTDNAIPPGQVGRDLALSADGRTIVFSDTVGGIRQLWVKTADRAEAEPLTGTIGGRAPTFSPDGEWIAFAAEGRIRKVPRTGGSAVTIADTAQIEAPAIAWLEGGVVAFSTQGFGLSLVPEDGDSSTRKLLLTLTAVALGVVFLNTIRLAVLATSPTLFAFTHGGAGAALFRFAVLALSIIAACVYHRACRCAQ